MKKAFPLLFFIALTNGAGYAVYQFRYKFLPGVNFVSHLDGLGSALASYSTAMMALVFALIVILTSLDNDNIRRFKAYGYINATYVFYVVCFLELGITFLLSMLCISNIKTHFIASLAITFSLITFIQVILIVVQIVLLSIKG